MRQKKKDYIAHNYNDSSRALNYKKSLIRIHFSYGIQEYMKESLGYEPPTSRRMGKIKFFNKLKNFNYEIKEFDEEKFKKNFYEIMKKDLDPELKEIDKALGKK